MKNLKKALKYLKNIFIIVSSIPFFVVILIIFAVAYCVDKPTASFDQYMEDFFKRNNNSTGIFRIPDTWWFPALVGLILYFICFLIWF